MLQFFSHLWILAGGRSGAGDFELPDYWDDGESLNDRDSLPVCITYNLASSSLLIPLNRTQQNQLPPVYFLDASASEELSVPNRLSLVYSCSKPTSGVSSGPLLLNSWLNAPVDFNATYLKTIIKVRIRMHGAIQCTYPYLTRIANLEPLNQLEHQMNSCHQSTSSHQNNYFSTF